MSTKLTLNSVVIVISVLPFCGCQASRSTWHSPSFLSTPVALNDGISSGQAAIHYDDGVRRMANRDAKCVDSFFWAAAFSWRGSEPKLHKSSLGLLIHTAQRHGRLINGRLSIQQPGGTLVRINTQCLGFDWKPSELGDLILVGKYHTPSLTRSMQLDGWGLPLVIVRKGASHRFLLDKHAIAATATLQTHSDDSTQPVKAEDISLVFSNPLTVGTIGEGDQRRTLAGDTTAPFAWMLQTLPSLAKRGFRQPGEMAAESKLFMLDGYQPGKRPLVLIHGVRSGAATWLELASQLRANDWFNRHWQIWLFRYPSGEPFVRSAADLRRELQSAVAIYSKEHTRPLPPQMVLVGHSMGGLIAKLQVTYSADWLWRATANRPIETLNASPEVRRDLRQMFHFKPLPFVRRVVFVATPHNGSAWANRLVGKVATLLVNPAVERRDRFERLVAANPGTFSPFVARRLPASVDLLQSDNPYLQAMERMRLGDVQLHSVIGTGRPMLAFGPADGVVPVSSAQHPGSSELHIDALHSSVHQRPETVAEVLRILRLEMAATGHLKERVGPAGSTVNWRCRIQSR